MCQCDRCSKPAVKRVEICEYDGGKILVYCADCFDPAVAHIKSRGFGIEKISELIEAGLNKERKEQIMPHPKETKIICEQYIAELQKEQRLSGERAVMAHDIMDRRYEDGTLRGLQWAEKWFRQHFGHFLKEE